MRDYTYRPLAFWIPTYIFSWIFWFIAAYLSHQPGQEAAYTIFMVLGLFAPAIIGLVLVLRAKIETAVIAVIAVIFVLADKKMFRSTRPA